MLDDVNQAPTAPTTDSPTPTQVPESMPTAPAPKVNAPVAPPPIAPQPPSNPPPSPVETVTSVAHKSTLPMKIMLFLLLISVLVGGLIVTKYSNSSNTTVTEASKRETQQDILNKYKIKLSPTITLAPEPTEAAGYENKFDETTQYENPFEENINPFDNL